MRPPRFLQSRDFWFAVSLAALAAVSMWLFISNRTLIAENQRELERQCNTVTTIDIAIVTPLLAETRLALKQIPRGSDRRAGIARFAANLQVAHEELAATQACEEIR